MIKIIIDGYNVIFECGLEDRNADSLQLERARYRLLREISDHISESSTQEILVVFDAKDRPRKDLPGQLRFRGLHVRFATEYPDADSYIEAFVAKHSAPKRLLVVSSDHRVQTAAKRRKAKFQDSDDWWTWLENQVPPKSTRNEGSTEDDLAPTDEVDWYDQLGGKDLEREIEAILQDTLSTSNGDGAVADSPAESSETPGEPRDPKQATLEELELDELNPFPPGYADDLFDESQ